MDNKVRQKQAYQIQGVVRTRQQENTYSTTCNLTWHGLAEALLWTLLQLPFCP